MHVIYTIFAFRLSHSQLEGLSEDDLLDMLTDATTLDEQASIIHYLWLKL